MSSLRRDELADLVRQGPQPFYAWRFTHPEAEADDVFLCGAHLTGADLSGASLRGATVALSPLGKRIIHGCDVSTLDLRRASPARARMTAEGQDCAKALAEQGNDHYWQRDHTSAAQAWRRAAEQPSSRGRRRRSDEQTRHPPR